MKEIVQVLKGLNIVYREPIVAASGKQLDYYVDIKGAYKDPRALSLIREELGKIVDKNATCVAAMGYGGISPATLVAEKLGLHLILIRDAPKKHGRGGFIDGYVPAPEDKIVLIDDVFTTGSSLRKMSALLESTGAQTIQACVIVKRGEGEISFPLKWVLEVEELL